MFYFNDLLFYFASLDFNWKSGIFLFLHSISTSSWWLLLLYSDPVGGGPLSLTNDRSSSDNDPFVIWNQKPLLIQQLLKWKNNFTTSTKQDSSVAVCRNTTAHNFVPTKKRTLTWFYRVSRRNIPVFYVNENDNARLRNLRYYLQVWY